MLLTVVRLVTKKLYVSEVHKNLYGTNRNNFIREKTGHLHLHNNS